MLVWKKKNYLSLTGLFLGNRKLLNARNIIAQCKLHLKNLWLRGSNDPNNQESLSLLAIEDLVLQCKYLQVSQKKNYFFFSQQVVFNFHQSDTKFELAQKFIG